MFLSDTETLLLQQVLLVMLVEFLRVCDRHRLRYFLVGGSALGAMKYKGFVPWDDDIDVALPRPDYETFLRVAPAELPPHLFLQTPFSDSSYPMQYAKLRNSQTSFVQPHVAHLPMHHGIFIDIYPLDGCPSGGVMQRVTKVALYTSMSAIRRKKRMLHRRGVRTVKGSILHPVVLLLERLPLRVLRAFVQRVMHRYPYDRSSTVARWLGSHGPNEIFPRRVFGEGHRAEFEGVSVVVPSDYDTYLRSLFGADYVKPFEKRKGPHEIDHLDLSKPYTRHVKPNNDITHPPNHL